MRIRHPRVVAGAALLLALAAGAAWLLRDPTAHFARRRSQLAEAREGATVLESGYALTPVRLTATSGLTVELVVRRALGDDSGPLPLAVVLGGHHTGREAARLVGDTRGVVVAALSYPFHGDPRPDAAGFLREVPRIRAAFLDTPPALMLALDYLLRDPRVDRARVEAVGVSLGAPFVCIAGALDPRFTRVWALHGSAGSWVPLEANMRRTIRFAPLRVVAATLADVVIAGPRLDPARWVSRIAPRPFVMVNAREDERLPREQVLALYRAARPPKELVWMEGRHIHADSATIQGLVRVLMARLRADAPDRAASSPPTPPASSAVRPAPSIPQPTGSALPPDRRGRIAPTPSEGSAARASHRAHSQGAPMTTAAIEPMKATGLPRLNEPAPPFEALTTHGTIRLSDFEGSWLILFSHPADFTPVCTTEFAAFAEIAPALRARNVELLGLSIDSVYSHLAWVRNIRERLGVEIPFPVIADLDRAVATAYGMIMPGESRTEASRCVFVIDPRQIVRAMIYYPLTTGRNMQEILRLVDALQTADLHQVATPANWEPGKKVIVPAPKTVEEVEKRMGAGFECADWYLCMKPLEMSMPDAGSLVAQPAVAPVGAHV